MVDLATCPALTSTGSGNRIVRCGVPLRDGEELCYMHRSGQPPAEVAPGVLTQEERAQLVTWAACPGTSLPIAKLVLRLLDTLEATERIARDQQGHLREVDRRLSEALSEWVDALDASKANAARLQSRIWTMTAEAEDHASDLLALREVAQITADEREAMRRERDEARSALDAMEVALGLPESCTRAEALHAARSLRSDRNEARAEIEALQAEINKLNRTKI